jgi:hypothetical protein
LSIMKRLSLLAQISRTGIGAVCPNSFCSTSCLSYFFLSVLFICEFISVDIPLSGSTLCQWRVAYRYIEQSKWHIICMQMESIHLSRITLP